MGLIIECPIENGALARVAGRGAFQQVRSVSYFGGADFRQRLLDELGDSRSDNQTGKSFLGQDFV